MKISPYSSRFLSRFIVKDAFDINDLNKVYPVLFFDTEHIESATLFVNSSKEYKAKAFKTKKTVLRGVGLFLEYCSAVDAVIEDFNALKNVAQCFYDTLIKGTISDESISLLWSPKKKRAANTIIHYIELYLNYCLNELSLINIFGPKFVGNKHYGKYQEYKLLSHLDRTKRNLNRLREDAKYQAVDFKLVKRKNSEKENREVKRFPPEKAFEMISSGCIVSRNSKIPIIKRFNVRNALLFSMYLFAGLRSTESLQLYTDDVEISKNLDQLNVHLAHPEEAPIIYHGEQMTRSEYLARAYRLKPRTELAGTKSAGWKGLEELDATTKSTALIWVAPEEVKLFLISLHTLYMNIRSEWIKNAPYRHPYYFVAEDGSPLKYNAVHKIWKQTCNRVGLTGLRRDGQHIHGARHNIAKILQELKLPTVVIKTVLHHVNILSQEKYKGIDVNEAQIKINLAFNEIVHGKLDGSKIDERNCHMKSDPKMIFTDLRKISGVI